MEKSIYLLWLCSTYIFYYFIVLFCVYVSYRDYRRILAVRVTNACTHSCHQNESRLDLDRRALLSGIRARYSKRGACAACAACMYVWMYVRTGVTLFSYRPDRGETANFQRSKITGRTAVDLGIVRYVKCVCNSNKLYNMAERVQRSTPYGPIADQQPDSNHERKPVYWIKP